MMFSNFFQLVSLLSLVQFCLGYTITEGSLKVGEQELIIGEFNTAIIKPLQLTEDDSIHLSLQFENLQKTPHQIVVTLGNDKGLEASFIPILKDNRILKLSIPKSKIPNSLKKESRLFLTLIVGDFTDNQPLYQVLGEILPSEELLNAEYKKPIRFGPKDEIHHIFRDGPVIVNPVISVIFMIGATVLLFALFGVWFTVGEVNFKNLPSGPNVVSHVGLLASIVGFEIVFLKYYLGASIFTTIYSTAAIAGPAIWFGSRVFRDLLKLRTSGKL